MAAKWVVIAVPAEGITETEVNPILVRRSDGYMHNVCALYNTEKEAIDFALRINFREIHVQGQRGAHVIPLSVSEAPMQKKWALMIERHDPAVGEKFNMLACRDAYGEDAMAHSFYDSMGEASLASRPFIEQGHCCYFEEMWAH